MSRAKQNAETLRCFIELSEEIGEDALDLFNLVEEALDRYELMQRIVAMKRAPMWESTYGSRLVSTDAYMTSPLGWSDLRHFNHIRDFN